MLRGHLPGENLSLLGDRLLDGRLLVLRRQGRLTGGTGGSGMCGVLFRRLGGGLLPSGFGRRFLRGRLLLSRLLFGECCLLLGLLGLAGTFGRFGRTRPQWKVAWYWRFGHLGDPQTSLCGSPVNDQYAWRP